jgi:putative hydrolase of the HAD superfamily
MKLLNEAAFRHKPDIVVFDLDHTLYDYDEAHRTATEVANRKACAALGISAGEFEQAFLTARQTVKRRLGHTASSHSRLLYFQSAIEQLGLKSRISLALELEQTYWRSLMLAAKLRPGALDFIMDVRALGATTAILSDLTAQIQFRKLVFFGLEGLFDFVVTSEEAGSDKEGLRPFALLKEKIAPRPDCTTWMVGDAACDLLARAELGAAILLLNTKTQIPDAQPDLQFSNFSDLSRLVRRWS